MVKKGSWSNEELEFLKDNYKDMIYFDIAEKLGRTKFSVQGRLQKLGLTKVEPKKLEVKIETDEFLKRCLSELDPDTGKNYLMKKLNITREKAEKIYNNWRENYINGIDSKINLEYEDYGHATGRCS